MYLNLLKLAFHLGGVALLKLMYTHAQMKRDVFGLVKIGITCWHLLKLVEYLKGASIF